MKKTVLITGCSSGIGRAAAFYFQRQGWQVAATCRSPERETELVHLPHVRVIALDVTDAASIDTAIQDTLAAFGSIDVLVNNAGYGLMGPFETLTEAQVRAQFETNVFGLMATTRAILPHFRSRRAGLIINVSSLVGRVPLPLYSCYNASKFAIEGFSEGLTYELTPLGIGIKLVEPGAVKTAFFSHSSDRGDHANHPDYAAFADDMLGVMDRIGAAGSTPEQAAETIFKAATDGRRQLRYRVGWDAHALTTGRALLPDPLFRRLIAFGLSQRAYDRLGQWLPYAGRKTS